MFSSPPPFPTPASLIADPVGGFLLPVSDTSELSLALESNWLSSFLLFFLLLFDDLAPFARDVLDSDSEYFYI